MGISIRALRRTLAVTAVGALVTAGALVATSSAQADTAPVNPTDPKTPVSVSADALPAPQIDGVVWVQAVSGNTVFVGGNFQKVRPAGAAAGTSTVSQPYFFSYNLTTGVMNAAFAPKLNAQVRAIVPSADGSTVYASGSFTTVNGVTRNRVAEFNATTGALITTFTATPNYVVNALALSGNQLFIGGGFTTVGGATHNHVASVNATTGAVNNAFTTDLEGGSATSLTADPDGSRIVVGGNFQTTNGSSNPGFGVAMVTSTTGSLLPLKANAQLRDASDGSGVTSLASDASGFYVSGYDYGGDGNFEGSWHASWTDGTLIWLEDCHGDSYSIAVTDNAEYLAGHPHVCSTLGGFPQTNPFTYHRGIAFTKVATQTLTRSADLTNWAGKPAPSLLDWFPDFNVGTFTGESQGPWSVATSADSRYVVYGGEFTTVNGVKQQGLVRFELPAFAPNKMGPTTNLAAPTFSSVGNTSVTVNWKTVSDQDNQTLTYSIYRDGSTTPIATKQVASTFWNLPSASWTDTTVTAGTTHTYRVAASDPFGNTQPGVAATVKTTGTAGGGGGGGGGGTTPTGYAATVASQGAVDYWRLDQASGTTAADSRGSLPMTLQAGVTSGTAGAISDGDKASTFNGTTTGTASTTSPITAPNTFSVAAWFKTTTTAGGKIVGFGDTQTGGSGKYDRHVFMNADGTLTYGVRTNGVNKPISTTAKYNDGAWHFVVGTTSSAGSTFYVDGKLVGSDASATSGQTNTGYWRIGGDKTWTTGVQWFAGSIDDVSIYAAPLSAAQVAAQWTAAGH
ncbi:LamG domain-containing protein [Frondihabitans australicus]|uniref:Concanavalin A-like lectin/glucanase superfamily protein n=1 Tax=Frondihabitans australicus TaxID=386892 RepID=A0A495IGF8_9MICO|nr:LamG domain-containing protein [Frondihabitans australicus]RKR75082.1 concanavalin A-like lectin/glucanase superfamily protein [Frondihabitans australicus]